MPEVPACAGDGGGGVSTGPIGPVWPCLLLAARLKMRPVWPRLALRPLVRGGPAGPGGGPVWPWLRIRGWGWEWPGAAKLLIQLHLVAFRLISHPPNPHPLPSPQRARGPDRLRGNDGCEQCSSQRGYGVRGSCRWFVVGVHPFGDLCVTALGGRSSSHPPARYACGGHPHAPGSGASPLCTPPFEGLHGLPL